MLKKMNMKIGRSVIRVFFTDVYRVLLSRWVVDANYAKSFIVADFDRDSRYDFQILLHVNV